MVRTRQSGQPRARILTPEDVLDEDVRPVPCTPDNRFCNVCAVRVRSPASLFTSALYGAGLMGRTDLLDPITAAYAKPDGCNGHAALRKLLCHLATEGVPVLMRLECRGASLDTYEKSSLQYAAGSLLMVFDAQENAVALAQPMGRLVHVAANANGFLPATAAMPGGGLECFVRIMGVVSYPALSKQQWFRGGAHDARFNWAMDFVRAPGAKDILKTNGYVPTSSPVAAMFPTIKLGHLGMFLGDFEAKLSSIQFVPASSGGRGVAGVLPRELKRQRAQQSVVDPANYCVWRRAVLLKLMLENDILYAGQAELRAMLPSVFFWCYSSPGTLPRPLTPTVRELLGTRDRRGTDIYARVTACAAAAGLVI
jgi:hypothetical protein